MWQETGGVASQFTDDCGDEQGRGRAPGGEPGEHGDCFPVLAGLAIQSLGSDSQISAVAMPGIAARLAVERQTQITAMILTLPENIEARLSPQSTALHLAIGLFVSDESTLGQAAEIAGISQEDFLRELGQRRIPIHYGSEELAADLKAVDFLAAR
ncbi:MAG: UPF0175 family protein [Verrucomicrobiota bacterium]|jgi:predicted HTH domain antitoxin